MTMAKMETSRKKQDGGPRPFTGRHMAMIMVIFFGIIIAVNVLMASLATGTFGGTVVDNSYIASQKFNQWLGQARAQDALEWQAHIRLDGERRINLTLAAREQPLPGAQVTGIIRHPVGRAPERTIEIKQILPGQYRASTSLPAGRWIVHFTIRTGGHEKRMVEDLQ